MRPIKITLNRADITAYFSKNPDKIKKTDKGNFCNIITFVNEYVDKEDNDVTVKISVKKSEESPKIGFGQTGFLQEKKDESLKRHEAKKRGEKPKNTFKKYHFTWSLNLTRLKEYWAANPNKQSDDFLIWESDTWDVNFNDISVTVPKVQGSTEKTIYIGNGRTAAAWEAWEKARKASNNPLIEQNTPIQQSQPKMVQDTEFDVIDELPF